MAAQNQPPGAGGKGRGRPPGRTDFVADVVQDPDEYGGSYVLSGFVGDSPEPDHTRLYQDPGLNSYVDVPNKAILNTRELTKEESLLGGAIVWVRKNARLKFGGAEAGQMGGMLEGPLTQDMGAAAGMAAGMAGPQQMQHLPPSIAQWQCASQLIVCRTILAACLSYIIPSCFRTCFRTCFPSCFQTCYQTCFRTCFRTCFQTCIRTCHHLICGGVQSGLQCEIDPDPRGWIDPAMGGFQTPGF